MHSKICHCSAAWGGGNITPSPVAEHSVCQPVQIITEPRNIGYFHASLTVWWVKEQRQRKWGKDIERD